MAHSRYPLNKILHSPVVLMVLRVALAGIFIYASWEKIIYPDAFASIVEGYKVLPVAVVPLVAIWLAWTELVAGAVLLAGVWTRAVGLLLSFLMFVFIAGLVQAMGRGIDIQCGCFSLDPEAAARSWASLWQEFLLLAACLWLWIGYWHKLADVSPGEEGTIGG